MLDAKQPPLLPDYIPEFAERLRTLPERRYPTGSAMSLLTDMTQEQLVARWEGPVMGAKPGVAPNGTGMRSEHLKCMWAVMAIELAMLFELCDRYLVGPMVRALLESYALGQVLKRDKDGQFSARSPIRPVGRPCAINKKKFPP